MLKVKNMPIRVLMGYIPDATEKDAKAYALGIAEKHNESSEISYYGIFSFDRGFIYEVHEGGAGKAFTPSIVKKFKEIIAKNNSEDGALNAELPSAIIPSATRNLMVEKGEDGINCLLLPEGDTQTPSEWLTTSALLTPAVPKRVGVFTTGVVVLVLGMLAMGGAMWSRYVPYEEAPKAKVVPVDYDKYPISQWQRVDAAIRSGKEVSALKYDGSKWDVKVKEEKVDKPAASPEVLPPTIPN